MTVPKELYTNPHNESVRRPPRCWNCLVAVVYQIWGQDLTQLILSVVCPYMKPVEYWGTQRTSCCCNCCAADVAPRADGYRIQCHLTASVKPYRHRTAEFPVCTRDKLAMSIIAAMALHTVDITQFTSDRRSDMDGSFCSA